VTDFEERQDRVDDFVARYRTQLLTARRRRFPWLPRISRPAAIAVVGVSFFGATAVATMTPWLPDLGPGHPLELQVAVSAAPRAQLDRLAVLRREQTPQDRKLAETYALRFFGQNTGSVRTDYVRTLAGDAPNAAVLVPVSTYTVTRVVQSDTSTPALRRSIAENGLCLFVGDAGKGGGQGCHSLEQLERGEIRGALAAGTRARFYGLVPDGVAQIRVRRPGAAPTDIDVRDNFYDFSLRSSGQDEPIAVQSLEWLGDDRTVLKRQDGWTVGGPRRPATQIMCSDGRVLDARPDSVGAECRRHP
jgi:hypothetical protein